MLKKNTKKPNLRFDDDDLFDTFTKKETPLKELPQPSYLPLPTFECIEDLDEVTQFMRDQEFEPGNIIGFCFRKPCAKSKGYWLNWLTNMASNYIHCEVVIFDSTLKYTRNLILTRNTRNVVFVSHVITKDQLANWDFVWVRITEEQRLQVREALYRILHTDGDRHFSACNIWCYPCFCMPCYFQCCQYSTRTCSEMTMTFIMEDLVQRPPRPVLSAKLLCLYTRLRVQVCGR